MANFREALPLTLINEGGWVHVDGDSGEETYRGIARAYFPGWIGWNLVDLHKPLYQGQIIRDSALDDMIAVFYKKNFWDLVRGDEVINQNIAADLFDKAVNMGVRQSVILCQRSLAIEETGVMNDTTVQILNNRVPFA